MIKNIVFSGGGFKSWAYIGSIQALEEYNIKETVEHIIGVSAGGVFGLFYLLGIKWEVLLDFFMDLNFKELFDIDIDNILVQQSLLAGKKFTMILREIMGLVTDPDITFQQLHLHTKTKFTVNALNIKASKLEYFNYELTPDIKVLDAIRASCTLPIVLPPYRIGDAFYYDGGICNNCPIEIVDEVDSIAFDISYFSETNESSVKLIDLLNCLVTICNKSDQKASYNIYNILDDSFKNESINFNQSRDDIFNIYMNGYINSKNMLFLNHKSLKWK